MKASFDFLTIEFCLCRKGVANMGKATQKLKEEHEIILNVLKLLDEMMSETSIENKVKHYDEMVYFLKMYADLAHHRKEEILFDEMCQIEAFHQRDLISLLLKEHELDSKYITFMDESLELRDYQGYASAAVKYRNLVKKHTEKENEELFVLADQILDEAKQNELVTAFENYEESVIGEELSHELSSMISAWTEELRKYDK